LRLGLDRYVAFWAEIQRALTGEYVSVMRKRLHYDPIPPLHSISRGAKIFIAMNEEVFESVLSNLLDNAQQHGGTVARICADIAATGKTPQAISTLSDNGPGISAANASKVFEPFFTTARKNGGTGLGLAVVKSLLAATHHGDIQLLPSAAGTAMQLSMPIRT